VEALDQEEVRDVARVAVDVRVSIGPRKDHVERVDRRVGRAKLLPGASAARGHIQGERPEKKASFRRSTIGPETRPAQDPGWASPGSRTRREDSSRPACPALPRRRSGRPGRPSEPRRSVSSAAPPDRRAPTARLVRERAQGLPPAAWAETHPCCGRKPSRVPGRARSCRRRRCRSRRRRRARSGSVPRSDRAPAEHLPRLGHALGQEAAVGSDVVKDVTPGKAAEEPFSAAESHREDFGRRLRGPPEEPDLSSRRAPRDQLAPDIRSSSRSWTRERSTWLAIAPTKARNMSHCVSQGSPCVPRKSVAAVPDASAVHHSTNS
jgi:hypothetical protein